VVVLVPQGAHADQRELQQPRAAVDAVLLVDASGSMLKTDAQMLRYDGAKLFLQFLGKDDRLAIVSFADKANVVSELKEFSKEPAGDVVKKIQGIKTEGQYSDILEGIRAAEKILEASPRNDADRVIILLSDGKMEPNPSVALPSSRTLELVNQILPELKAKEIKVHSLAFSDQADKMLLSEISAATDGLNWYTANSDQVHKSFANLFLAVKRPQVVPMRSRSFALDDDVDEATFYITREEGSKLTLISPKNQEMTVDKFPEWITWFAGKNFDVITMKEPDVGEWQVQGGVSAEGFATVLTNLKLVTDWPVIIRVDDKNVVQARLYDGEKPVSLPEMSGVVQYAFQVMPTDRVAAAVAQDFLNDEGRDGDRVARDGIFSKYCTISEIGEYKLSIVARGPTFERTQQVPFRVRPRLVNLDVLSAHGAEVTDTHGEHEHGGDANAHASSENSTHGNDAHGGEPHGDAKPSQVLKGDQTFVMRAEISREALSFRDLEVKIEALSQERRKTVIPLKRHTSEGLRYEALTEALPDNGVYSIKATLKGISKKGQEIEAESPPVRFELKSTVKRTDPTPAVVVKATPVEPKQEDKFPVLPIVVGSLASIVAMVVGVLLTKRSKSSVAASVRYNPPKQMLDAIASLEEKLVSSDIKIGDVKLETEPEPTKEPTPLDTAEPIDEAPSEGRAPPSSEGA
jgi:hypothetical protein